MLVAIDIGNTHNTIGVFSKTDGNLIHYGNFQTDKHITTDELAIKYTNLKKLWEIGNEPETEVIISSVVPQIDYEFKHMFEKYYHLTPHFVKNDVFPLEINYDQPKEIGADRLVNAYSGIMRFPGENLIIIDFGTATTFDVISKGSVYEGGIIQAGILQSLRALENKASKLPHIDLAIPNQIVGKNTIDGIRSGMINATGAMVDETCRRIGEEMEWESFRVIATGGFSKLLLPVSRVIDGFYPHLTLEGLYKIWKYLFQK